MEIIREPGSFRDSDGFVFYHDNKVFRFIHQDYLDCFSNASQTLFPLLHKKKWLVPHTNLVDFSAESAFAQLNTKTGKIIQVDKVPFISYPYEWSFEQLKSAALLTLKIQKNALENGFSLKDATAYNVQFFGTRPVFIDTLSFEEYKEGTPWQAYRQFCQHFLAPLLLSHYNLGGLSKLSACYIDGIPLELASKLLPGRTRFNFLCSAHIHFHAKAEAKHSESRQVNKLAMQISRSKLFSLIEHLTDGIRGLGSKKTQTNWTDYYATCSYNDAGFAAKSKAIENWLSAVQPEFTIDAGCNTGFFSELAAKYSRHVVAFDFDASVIGKLYTKIKAEKNEKILPLVIDLTNPSSSIGWANEERKSAIERFGKNNVVMALALIHHLAIGNNVPLHDIARTFALFAGRLIIEFVPKTDVQVSKLLVTKKDIFHSYSLENFETAFAKYFEVVNRVHIPGSDRVLFHLKSK